MSTDCIEASVLLSVDDKTRHWLYFKSRPRTDAERQASVHKEDMGGAGVQCKTIVYNGRGNGDLILDKASFELVECPTTLSKDEFYKIQEGDFALQEKYKDEVTSFIKEKLGCDKVVCFHSQVRNGSRIGEGGVQGYASGGPHTDSSAVSADELAIHTVNAAGEDVKKYGRYLYLNLWRNIADKPIENDHLAVLDERTAVKPDDYIVKDLFGDGYSVVQYGLNARHASNHKWYYFPKMEKNEAILFKQMDSDWTKPGRVCFHMSIPDPNRKEDAHTRESIEMRMICFWESANTSNSVNSMPTKENMHQNMVKDPLEMAKGASSSVHSASVWELTMALIRKIPLLGSFFAGNIGNKALAGAKYSGKPDDYLAKFVGVVDSFPSWPAFGRDWIRQQMKQVGPADVEKGIENITRELVNDSLGYQGTKPFRPEEKKEIANFLIANEKYMGTARKHWSDFGNSDGADAGPKYSGKPDDYLEKFIDVVNSFPSWDSFGRDWIKGEMKQAGPTSVEKGIEKITRALVDDAMGYQGTKPFQPEEKKELADFLITNKKYMDTAKTHWGGLA